MLHCAFAFGWKGDLIQFSLCQRGAEAKIALPTHAPFTLWPLRLSDVPRAAQDSGGKMRFEKPWLAAKPTAWKSPRRKKKLAWHPLGLRLGQAQPDRS